MSQVFRLELDHLNSKRFLVFCKVLILILIYFHQKLILVFNNLALTIVKAVFMEKMHCIFV